MTGRNISCKTPAAPVHPAADSGTGVCEKIAVEDSLQLFEAKHNTPDGPSQWEAGK
jgi:hypothetical protein